MPESHAVQLNWQGVGGSNAKSALAPIIGVKDQKLPSMTDTYSVPGSVLYAASPIFTSDPAWMNCCPHLADK